MDTNDWYDEFGGDELDNLEDIDSEWTQCPNHDSVDTLKSTIASPSFQNFAGLAYALPSGFAVRINENTNKKEMFVAGSRTMTDWKNNLSEYTRNGLYDEWRLNKQEQIADIAAKEKVDVVYGHSRGGALVADMPLPMCTQKIGLDAAMVLAGNKDMLNLTESGTGNWGSSFDKMLARTGRYNVPVDFSPWSPHRVWKV